MKKGRKPKPKHLRLLEGNPGKRPVREEPRPVNKAPSCPAWLLRTAKVEWRRVVGELVRLGLVTQIDRATLAAYCQCWARWREAEEALEELGLTMKTRSGYVLPRPEVAIARGYLKQMRESVSDMGMSPAARVKVSLVPPKGDEDEMEEFFP